MHIHVDMDKDICISYMHAYEVLVAQQFVYFDNFHKTMELNVFQEPIFLLSACVRSLLQAVIWRHCNLYSEKRF